jgi:hypothetical protein
MEKEATFVTSSLVVIQAIVTLRSTTGEIISLIARSIAKGTILYTNIEHTFYI